MSVGKAPVNRYTGGRPSKLDDPDTLKKIAEAFADGQTRKQMAEAFGVSDLATITRWRKDIRVKAEVRKLIEERITRISQRTDSVIENRLKDAENLSIDELIKIRKEFGGSALIRRDVDQDAAMTEAFEALESNPDLMQEVQELLRRAGEKRPAAEPVEVPDALPVEV